MKASIPEGGGQRRPGDPLSMVQEQPGTTMKSKQVKKQDQGSAVDHELSTPLLDKYLRAMRKHIRFPRYYKRELNW
jgi:hypothetical protein